MGTIVKGGIQYSGFGGQGAEIDDTVERVDKTWSSRKIAEEVGSCAKTTSVYTKTQTYTKAEVDALISQAGGGAEIDDSSIVNNKTWSSQKINSFNGVKRFILKPYEIQGIVELFGANEAFTHHAYMFELLTTNYQEKLPLIITKSDGTSFKAEIRGFEYLPWNENELNSEYPSESAVYRKFSIGGIDFAICFTGNHVIDNKYYPDVIIAVDGSSGISNVQINTTDYSFQTYGIGGYDSDNTPEQLYRDYDAYPTKNQVVTKNWQSLVRYNDYYGLEYYQSYDDSWHSCLYEQTNFLHVFSSYLGSVLSCWQFGNQIEYVFKLKADVTFTANQMEYIGWCSKDPVGVDGIKINGFVYDDSSYFNIDDASCIVYKHSDDSLIYLGFKSNYTTTGNEIIRFSYLIDTES